MSQAKNQPHGGMGPGPKHGPGGPRHMMVASQKNHVLPLKDFLNIWEKIRCLLYWHLSLCLCSVEQH